MGHSTSILLVGKPGHVRDALAGLIDSLPISGPENVLDPPHLSCACDCQQAVELARQDPPAVILFAGAPFDSLCAATALDEIRHAAPLVRCLVLTETPNQTETHFPAADAILPISASFDLFKATIEGLLKLGC